MGLLLGLLLRIWIGPDALADRLGGYTGRLELTVTGHIADGRLFTGSDTIRLR